MYDGNGQKVYSCQFCSAIFNNFRGLGGHIANNHSTMSSAYKAKMERRERRKLERQALSIAKSEFKELITRKGKESWFVRNRVK